MIKSRDVFMAADQKNGETIVYSLPISLKELYFTCRKGKSVTEFKQWLSEVYNDPQTLLLGNQRQVMLSEIAAIHPKFAFNEFGIRMMGIPAMFSLN